MRFNTAHQQTATFCDLVILIIGVLPTPPTHNIWLSSRKRTEIVLPPLLNGTEAVLLFMQWEGGKGRIKVRARLVHNAESRPEVQSSSDIVNRDCRVNSTHDEEGR